MATIWLISDTHFGHAAILGFRGRNEELIRPGFSSVEEMDACMVDRWNERVRPSDHVYHLGDVAMRKEHLATVRRLAGKKRLVRGNHDIFRTRDYLEAGFQEIHGCRVLANMLLTHIPVHPDSLGRFVGNVHGHVHERPSPPGAYLNVSAEALDYAPITLEEACSRLQRVH